MQRKIGKLFSKIQEMLVVQSIRFSLITLIPILMIGSFFLVAASIPLDGYQNVISTWNNGVLLHIFNGIYNATFGMLSMYTAGMVGYHYGNLYGNFYAGRDRNFGHATLMVSLGGYFVLSGVPDVTMDVFGPKGMFTAIVSACIASRLFMWLFRRMHHKTLLTDGADVRLGLSIQTIFPAAITIGFFVVLNMVIQTVFDVSSVYELIIRTLNGMFTYIRGDLWRGLSFVIVSSVLWFFGIHGGNMLDGVSNDILLKATEKNMQLVAQGKEATEILTKQVIDFFVLLGGCGATMCLLVALFIFSKRSNTKQMAKCSAFPMLFNVNEIMVFGFPIIYNATLLIPFLCTPVVCFLITYISMKTGLVPLVTQDVEWTTPIFISGYKATGSLAGSVLQLVNLCVGVLIYAPFVKRYDAEKVRVAKRDYQKLVCKLQESEQTRIPLRLMDDAFTYGWMGKALAADLKLAIEKQELKLYYQPQYHADGTCIGAEALLRWNHAVHGNIYPPLIFQLAEEAGFLEKLEEWVVWKATFDMQMLQKKYADHKLKISVNVTGTTIQLKAFESFLKNLADTCPLHEMGICIEVTEQAALRLDDVQIERFHRIREMGYMLAVDDFSMGSTSIQYLTGSYFDLVKLDGSLVRGTLDNPRCCEIISSIVQLTNSLDMMVLAEYVSDAAIQEKLLELGCELYQGSYFSPPITLSAFEKLLQEN